MAVAHPHHGPRHIKRALGVHAGHLGGLAAQQRAACGAAGLGDAGHHGGDVFGHKAAGGDIVEEKERAGILHQNIVDAVVDNVVANTLPALVLGGQFHLGAHAIGGGDKHRLRRQPLQRKKAAKAAHIGQHRGRMG